MSMFETLRAALEGTAWIRLAVLFGSEARETAGPASDIDLGLLVTGDAPEPARLAVDLERLTRRPVHLVLLDEAPPLLRSRIGRSGRVLVERQPHAWADFPARAMIDWWDWKPTAEMIPENGGGTASGGGRPWCAVTSSRRSRAGHAPGSTRPRPPSTAG